MPDIKISSLPTGSPSLSHSLLYYSNANNRTQITTLANIGGLPSGTQTVFQQTAAPTGWTKNTTFNDVALRVVSGVATTGGSTAFSSVFNVRQPSDGVSSVGGTVLNVNQSGLVSHTHLIYWGGCLRSRGGCDGNTSGYGGSYARETSGVNGGARNASEAHSHSMALNNYDFRAKYVDVILATKT